MLNKIDMVPHETAAIANKRDSHIITIIILTNTYGLRSQFQGRE